MQVGKISVFFFLFSLRVVPWKLKKENKTGYPWPVFNLSKHKENGFFFQLHSPKRKEKCVSKRYCKNCACFNCRRPVLRQYNVKQGDKLSGYEGFESVIFEEHGSYCCISTSDWCSLSSWNFIPFIIQLMFPIPFSSVCPWFMWSRWLLVLENSPECTLTSTGEGLRAFFSLRWEVYRASHTCWFFPYFPQSITSFFL